MCCVLQADLFWHLFLTFQTLAFSEGDHNPLHDYWNRSGGVIAQMDYILLRNRSIS